MKKIIALLVSLIMMVSFSTISYANQGDIMENYGIVKLNDVEIEIPIDKSGVPISITASENNDLIKKAGLVTVSWSIKHYSGSTYELYYTASAALSNDYVKVVSVNSIIASNGSALNNIEYLNEKVYDVRTASVSQTSLVGSFDVPSGATSVRLEATGVTVLLHNNGWIACTDAAKTVSI